MTQFTKKSFKTVCTDGKGNFAKKVDGYEYTAFAVDGNVFKMHVYQDGNEWRVIDPMTGLSFCKGETRAKAVEKASTPESVRNFANMIKLDKYTAMVDKFIDLCAAAEPKPAAKPKATSKPKAPKAPAKPKSQAKSKSAKPKAPAKPKADELAKAQAEIAELKARIAELENPKVEQVAASDLASVLKEMQQWCEDKPNVSAYQKNGGCVRVVGETKPYQSELNEKGFRWSRKGFWYMGERELEKRNA